MLPASDGRRHFTAPLVQRRLMTKTAASHTAYSAGMGEADRVAALVGSAMAWEMADEPPLQNGVKRQNVHWTHVRTFNAAWVQPDQVTRLDFWNHLEKVYREAYPVAGSPTGSVLAFGVVCQERHATSEDTAQRDLHRHAPTCSTRQIYWNKIAKISLEKYGWPLNAVSHDSYHTMYSYVRDATAKKPLHEIDATPFFSPHHPKDEQLATFLAASAASSTRKLKRKVDGGKAGRKRERLPSIFGVIKEHSVATGDELQAHACSEAAEGRVALAEYCARNGSKLDELVANARAIMDAPARIASQKMTLMQKLEGAAGMECTCGGCWAAGAEDILQSNHIPSATFCAAVRRALEMGAKRGVNVACVGEQGCGKSTLLEPMEEIFGCFCKPQGGSTFALANVIGSDVILWQDYLHDEKTVRFADLLCLFVGESVGVRLVAKNKGIRNKAPTFYSGLMPMRCGFRDRTQAEKLDGMMDDRFTIFRFVVSIARERRKPDWKNCGRCAAAFYLQRHDQPTLPLALGAPSSLDVAARPGPSIAESLVQLAHLHAVGAIDDEEYRAAKRCAIGRAM